MIGALLCALLPVEDSVAVDRCQLAAELARYATDARRADRVLTLLPAGLCPCAGACGSEPSDAFYEAVQQLRPILRQRLRAGDAAAWKVALGRRRRADGGLLEDVDGDIGVAISAQPRAYLRAALAFPGDGTLGVASFMGERFADATLSVRCGELRERMGAIASVRDPELAEVRGEVVRLLESRIEACR